MVEHPRHRVFNLRSERRQFLERQALCVGNHRYQKAVVRCHCQPDVDRLMHNDFGVSDEASAEYQPTMWCDGGAANGGFTGNVVVVSVKFFK